MPANKEPPLGMAVVTVTSTAATLDALLTTAAGAVLTVPTGAVSVILQPRGGNIRLTDDGQTPVVGASGLGYDVFDGASFIYTGDLADLKLIASANTVCTAAFYG